MPSEPAPPPDPTEQCKQLIARIGSLLTDNGDASLLRYEAFNGFFALLGRTMDADTIEIIQTGLASLDWERLGKEQRVHLATHLHHIARQVDPDSGKQKPQREAPRKEREPYYDRISFGDQSRLVRALREQPSDISLDQLLRSLAGTDRNGS